MNSAADRASSERSVFDMGSPRFSATLRRLRDAGVARPGEGLLRFLNFYGSQQKSWAPGVRLRVRGELRHGFFGREMVHPTVRIVQADTPLATSLTPVYPTR